MSRQPKPSTGGLAFPSLQDALAITGLVAAGAVIGIASAYWGWSDQSNIRASEAGIVEHFASGDESEQLRQRPSRSHQAGLGIDKRFHRAADAVRAHKGFSLQQKSRLYGLFKQATMGACHSPQPSLVDAGALFKWRAWMALGDTSHDDAKRAYCLAVSDYLPGYDQSNGDAMLASAREAASGGMEESFRPMPMMGALGPDEGDTLAFKLPSSVPAPTGVQRGSSSGLPHSSGLETGIPTAAGQRIEPDGVIDIPHGASAPYRSEIDAEKSEGSISAAVAAKADALVRALEEPTDPAAIRAILIETPALARSRNQHGETPLHLAAELDGDAGASAVTELLRAGADPNAREKDADQTPLMYAMAAARFQAAENLIRGGGDWGAKDRDGHVAADLVGAATAGDASQAATLSRLREIASEVGAQRATRSIPNQA